MSQHPGRPLADGVWAEALTLIAGARLVSVAPDP